MAYTEQITFLLFLKMADEQTKPPYNRAAHRAAELRLGRACWSATATSSKSTTATSWRNSAKKPGMLGEIFKKARRRSRTRPRSRRLIVDLIDPERWISMHADVKGDIYEGLLAQSAAESPKGAGQYFTPRELIQAIVDVVQPRPRTPSATRPAAPAAFCSPPTTT